MHLKRLSVSITTTGSTDTTSYSSDIANGLVHAVQYIPGDLNSTGIATVYAENTTDMAIVSAKANTTDNWTLYPRQAVHDSTGATTSWSTDAGLLVDKYPLFDERVKVVTEDSSTSVETGTIYVYVEGA